MELVRTTLESRVWAVNQGTRPPTGAKISAAMPIQPIEAVIFDMDGVLADSEPLYHLSLNQVLQAHGHSLTDEDNRIILGTTVEFTWQTLKDRFQLEGDLQDWIGVYDEVLLKNLRENIEPSPGLYSLLDTLDGRGLPFGLASSSQGNWVDVILTILGVRERFRVVMSGDMVTDGKPAPEIYLTAASKLCVEPARCLVFEDSPHGIQAGKAAGMTVVAVLTEMTQGMDLSHADHHIKSLSDFDLALLQPSG